MTEPTLASSPALISGESPSSWPWTIALLTAVAIGILPAIADVVDHLQSPQSTGVPPWAVVALAVGALEVAYLIVLIQLRQRAAYVAVRIALLVVAMGYASLLGLSLFGGADSATLRWLGLSSSLNFARGWSFLATSVTSLAAMLVERGSPGRSSSGVPLPHFRPPT